MNGRSRGLAWIGMTVGGIFVLWLIVFAVGWLSARSTPQAGEIGVVRNGSDLAWAPDWFDNHKIRGIVPNGSGNTYIGLGSEVHYYPVASQQRFFRMATCYDGQNREVPCEGADGLAVTVPTSDGVEVTLSGTFYLNTAFDDTPAGEKVLQDFDTQFATRTFGGKHPYDGIDGWEKFLSAIIEPIIQNNMRQTVGGITCAQLVSSCALVQNSGSQLVVSGSQAKPPAGSPGRPSGANSNVQKIETDINNQLETDLRNTLGEYYFRNVQFRLGGAVQLPEKVQQAIDSAQAAFASVTQAQADANRASLEAKANENRQAGYNKCPTCAAIDQIKAIPHNITVWAPGSNSAITVGGK